MRMSAFLGRDSLYIRTSNFVMKAQHLGRTTPSAKPLEEMFTQQYAMGLAGTPASRGTFSIFFHGGNHFENWQD